MEDDEEEVVSKERMEELKKTLPSMFNPGDLAWARLGVAPYWPCTITLDPDQKIHSNVSLRGKKPHREYHVQVHWIKLKVALGSQYTTVRRHRPQRTFRFVRTDFL